MTVAGKTIVFVPSSILANTTGIFAIDLSRLIVPNTVKFQNFGPRSPDVSGGLPSILEKKLLTKFLKKLSYTSSEVAPLLRWYYHQAE